MSNHTNQTGDLDMGVQVPSLIGLIVFYLVILAIGIFASWKSKAFKKGTKTEDVMLAGRNIGLVVGIFTMTATWVGGGYINGTAEYVYTTGYGLVWCQAPIGYAISLFLGGLIFAKPMREAGYVTMLDPFQLKYGRVITAFLYLPALLGDVFWTAAILSALGSSLKVILGLSHLVSVIISAAIAVFYTFLGGLYSVAFTDVIQLICIFIGLWLAIPFALLNSSVTSIAETAHYEDSWLGSLAADAWIGLYIDSYLLLIMGGIPWQVYIQRVLSQRTARRAQMLSIAAAFGAFIMAIPAVLIGAIAKSANWTDTAYGREPEEAGLALPLVLQYLTPTPVAVIGLGAVSAAVMSSADSSILSSSSMFARNVYTPLRNAMTPSHRREASDAEVLWVMRVMIIVVGAAATVLAIVVKTVYGLWYLSSDLVYVILFPQLLCAVLIPFTNTYGSIAGYILGLIFRLTGGELLLNLPPAIKYPYYDEASGYQLFPFKTMSMLISLITILFVSFIARAIHQARILPSSFDVFNCFSEGRSKYTISGSDNPAYQNESKKTSTTF